MIWLYKIERHWGRILTTAIYPLPHNNPHLFHTQNTYTCSEVSQGSYAFSVSTQKSKKKKKNHLSQVLLKLLGHTPSLIVALWDYRDKQFAPTLSRYNGGTGTR